MCLRMCSCVYVCVCKCVCGVCIRMSVYLSIFVCMPLDPLPPPFSLPSTTTKQTKSLNTYSKKHYRRFLRCAGRLVALCMLHMFIYSVAVCCSVWKCNVLQCTVGRCSAWHCDVIVTYMYAYINLWIHSYI